MRIIIEVNDTDFPSLMAAYSALQNAQSWTNWGVGIVVANGRKFLVRKTKSGFSVREEKKQ